MKDTVIQKLNLGSNVFLTGGAGVGKTTITNEVIKTYEAEAKKVAKLASTAMAATLIGGQTLHSFFDLGICEDTEALKLQGKFEIPKKVKKLLAVLDLIVIDEISMVSAALLEMVALRLKQGGFRGVLLVVGDFLQLPPVSKGFVDVAFAFESAVWSEFAFEPIELTHIYRTDDVAFIELLHHIRFGFVDEVVHNKLNGLIKPIGEDLSNTTFLYGKNISASRHNKEQLEAIEGELFVKEAQVVKHKKSLKDHEIKRFFQDARIEEELELKIGAPVLFSRNAWNYYNGERGVVVNIDATYVYVQKSDGKVVKLEQVAQHKTVWVEKTIAGEKQMVQEEVLSIYQYPIKLAFAITIHKSQGMSIESLVIDTNEIFAPSQFYVALSRSSNPHQLTLIAPKKQWWQLAYVNPKALAFVKGLGC
ncbi:MAG: AAA family ATPase [Epsilonproteobacteria bacterium]|nr:AAA family ATPase [Campylobacterota bacterium]